MARFGDPTFQYQAAMAQVWGTLALQLAIADILPFDYETYATDLIDTFETVAKFWIEKQNC